MFEDNTRLLPIDRRSPVSCPTRSTTLHSLLGQISTSSLKKPAWDFFIVIQWARTPYPDLERATHEEITLALVTTRAGVLCFLTQAEPANHISCDHISFLSCDVATYFSAYTTTACQEKSLQSELESYPTFVWRRAALPKQDRVHAMCHGLRQLSATRRKVI